MKKFLIYLLLVFSIGLTIIGLIFNNVDILILSVVLFFLHNIFFAIIDFNKRIIFFVFNIAFFMFLVGGIICVYITGVGGFFRFSNDILVHTLLTLNISLLTIAIFYNVFERLSNKKKNKLSEMKINYESEKIRSIRKAAKLLFYIALVPTLLITAEKIIFVSNNSYLDYYLEYSTKLPYLFLKISETISISFFVYLATMPTKIECRNVVIIYISIGLFTMLTGGRFIAVINITMVIIYYIIRNSINSYSKNWFGKDKIILCLICVPLFFLLLFTVGMVRSDYSLNGVGVIESFASFFRQTGASVDTIEYGKFFENEFPINANYTFGPIIDYFKNNSLALIYSQTGEGLRSQTVEMALYGNSFSNALTYIVNPSLYLAGGGMGSSYIAESYKDFGYVGVFLINVFYSFILANVVKCLKKSVWVGGIVLIITTKIILAPRGSAFGFIDPIFLPTGIATLLIIYLISTIFIKKTAGLSKRVNFT